ncbi:hypothetical protein RJ639_034429 [Escallonia herrerae]|uniref:Glutaredoxin domain-containing protein n=1 Tax=Escallonia herrerae TaxID=1293975 RepID=A0AA88WV23_9ASTE|nr:hypothetical protein RJ639_034429 [Escallonia herrerae]
MHPYDPPQRPKVTFVSSPDNKDEVSRLYLIYYSNDESSPYFPVKASSHVHLLRLSDPNSPTEKMHYQAMEESWREYYYVPALEQVVKLASKSAVVVFSLSSCCMCHAVKRLFCGMGVNPTVYELDQDPIRGKEIERALTRLLGGGGINGGLPAVPVVFIGGKLVGAMDRVMASHINGTLVPLLKEAGALWL